MAKGLHCVVSGKVQGVWFRAWTRDLADSLGIKGWVRNKSDGSVEVLAQAEQAVLEEFRQRLLEGPPLARVAGVEAELVEAGEAFADFDIRR